MFDNRWDNWAGDFAESFPASLIDSSVRNHLPEILSFFGQEVRKIDREFPDVVSPGTFRGFCRNRCPGSSWATRPGRTFPR